MHSKVNWLTPQETDTGNTVYMQYARTHILKLAPYLALNLADHRFFVCSP